LQRNPSRGNPALPAPPPAARRHCAAAQRHA
jgi:hypothetical protein